MLIMTLKGRRGHILWISGCELSEYQDIYVLIRLFQHLSTILAKELPNVNVDAAIYPKYKTQGDLNSAVEDFRGWFSALYRNSNGDMLTLRQALQ